MPVPEHNLSGEALLMCIRFALIPLLLIFTVTIAAAEDVTIAAVVVEGNHRVETSTILGVVKLKVGELATSAALDRDLHALYKLGKFTDVRLEIVDRDGQQQLLVTVVERPLVRSLKFTGQDELDEEKLKGLVTVRVPGLYDPGAVDKSIEAIKKAYLEDGFYAATIKPQLEMQGELNEAVLTFAIDEGEQVLIDTISFEGNKVFEDGDLREMMETEESFWLTSWMTGSGTYEPEKLQRDVETIADNYFDVGHVQVKVKNPQVLLSEDKEDLNILIEIEEGDQFRIGDLDVRGDLLMNRDGLLALVKLRPGDIFSRKVLREGVTAISDFYADQGYAYVNVTPLSRLDLEKHTVNLVFEIEQGRQVYIERIRMSGNVKSRDKVLRRELKVAEGDLYNATNLKESKRRLTNLGFFEEIKVNPVPGSDDGKMNLDIEVKEKPTGTFSLGFGYSSVDKIVGQGSVAQENFLGLGYKLNLSGAFGSSSTTYQIGLTDPYFLDSKWTLGFDIYNTDREYTDFSKRATGGDIKAGYPIREDMRGNLLYRYEQKEIYDVDADATTSIKSQEGFSTLSSITGSLVRDTTDYRLDPSRGSISVVSTEFAGLGGTEKFVKMEGDYRHFFPAFWSTVFCVHGRVGFIAELGDEEVPIDERYYLGGLNSIRGFEPRTVGPRTAIAEYDSTGATIVGYDYEYTGGNKAAYFNLEYVFPLVKEANIKGLFFYDIGNAWDDGEQYFSNMRKSTGAGIRWTSPLGPLRLEWGYNLDPIEGEKTSDLQFSIGSFF